MGVVPDESILGRDVLIPLTRDELAIQDWGKASNDPDEIISCRAGREMGNEDGPVVQFRI